MVDNQTPKGDFDDQLGFFPQTSDEIISSASVHDVDVRAIKSQMDDPYLQDRRIYLQNGGIIEFPKSFTEEDLRSLCAQRGRRRCGIFLCDRKQLKRDLKEYIIKSYLISNELL